MKFMRQALLLALLPCLASSISVVAAAGKDTAFPGIKRKAHLQQQKQQVQQQHQQHQQQQQQQKQQQVQRDDDQDDDDDDVDDDHQQSPAPQQSLAPQPPPEQQQPQTVTADSADAVAVAPAAPAVVPPPAHLGASGFPELPTVSKMLDSASASLRSVSSETKMLESRLTQTQLENEAKLAKQKAIFEQKLKAQEETNRQVLAANKRVSEEISGLKRENTGLRNHAISLEDSNVFTRTELKTLLSKLGAAQGFITGSLTKTDDAGSKDRAVLGLGGARGRRSRRALLEVRDKSRDDGEIGEDYLGGDGEDDNVGEAGGEAFISVASRVERPAEDDAGEDDSADPAAAAPGPDGAEAKATTPGDLVTGLSQGVQALQREGKESQLKLRQMFIGAFQTGARRHAALMAEQKALIATRDSLLSLKSRLTAAVQHLDGNRKDLERRLRGLGLFLQKVAHFALAPAAEAARLQEELPARVTPAAPPTKKTA